MVGKDKISLEYILIKILLDLKKKKRITNGNIEVIISPYYHIKDYLTFKLNQNSKEPLVAPMSDFTFYIYDDFSNINEYHKYNHINIDYLSDNHHGIFRVDYLVL